MSLTWTGFTAEDFMDEFEQSTSVTRRESKVIMRAGAKDIMKASQEMAPVDEGNLEAAHHIAEIRSNVDELFLEIEVGGEVGDRDVSEYAVIVHEGLLPFGSGPDEIQEYIKGTGRLSQSYIKNATNPSDRPVGGKFLERALDLYEDKITEAISETLPGEA